MAASACQWLGVAIDTMSIDLSSKAFRMSLRYCGLRPELLPTFSARWRPMASSGSTTATTSVSFRREKALRCDCPRPRTPTTATCSRSLGLFDCFSAAGTKVGAPATAAAAAVSMDCSRKSRRVFCAIVRISCDL
ncbi:MAG: hypothetical protein Ct9H300mP1_08470 [Planctomycetaceae bacterium]|nr:MAG: hypothetical protein Ct9H300mP1_08470 [Planctomycetaceae bacterium]